MYTSRNVSSFAVLVFINALRPCVDTVAQDEGDTEEEQLAGEAAVAIEEVVAEPMRSSFHLIWGKSILSDSL